MGRRFLSGLFILISVSLITCNRLTFKKGLIERQLLKRLKAVLTELVFLKDRDICAIREFRFKWKDIRSVAQTIHRIAKFWIDYHKDVIVDGLFGVRLSQGILQKLFTSINHFQIPIHAAVSNLRENVDRAAELTWQSMKLKNDSYSSSFLGLLREPWYYVRKMRHAKEDLLWNSKRYAYDLNETQSDKCVQQLFSHSKYKRKCFLSSECLFIELRKETSGYYLTHQGLYFLIAERSGCHKEIADHVGGEANVEKLYDILGSNMYQEMIKTDLGNSGNWDLFAEQGIVCAVMGITECFRLDFMRKVMKWVEQNGCVSPNFSDESANEKRQDFEIGSCSQHTTSIVMAFLTLHLKFMVEHPCLLDDDVHGRAPMFIR